MRLTNVSRGTADDPLETTPPTALLSRARRFLPNKLVKKFADRLQMSLGASSPRVPASGFERVQVIPCYRFEIRKDCAHYSSRFEHSPTLAEETPCLLPIEVLDDVRMINALGTLVRKW
jgi:hypothetical protein